MRRSVTTYEPVSLSQGLKRAATTSAAPSLSMVEERMSDLGLLEAKSDDDNFSGIKYAALPGSSGTELDEESPESHESHEYSPQVTEMQEISQCTSESENAISSSSEYEGDLEDGSSTLETSANDSIRPEEVHRPLRDLIFKTNKEFYDVDSNRVKIKVGLSKNVPSLHPKRNINGASLIQ